MEDRQSPQTQSKHRQQTFWQIWLPLGITLAVFLTLAVLASLASASNPATGELWAAISLIFMLIPVLLAGLVFLAITVGLIYGMAKLFGVAPTYLKKGQYYTYLGASYVLKWADQSVQPILWVQQRLSQVKKFFERLFAFSFVKK